MAGRWGATRKRAAGGRRRRRSRSEDSDEEDDDDYVAEEAESVNSEESNADSDSDSEESDEESFHYNEDTSSEESDEEDAAPKRRRRSGGVPKKQKKMDTASDDDEAEAEAEEAMLAPKKESRVNGSQRRRRKSNARDLVDDGDDDEDFSLDAAKNSKENQHGRMRKSKASKANERKRKKSAAAVPARKTRRTVVQISDDEEFLVKDKGDMWMRRRRKKKGALDLESSDSDFVVSGDGPLAMDISDFEFVLTDDDEDARKKKKRSVRKKDTSPKPRNNRKLLISDISNFNCMIPKEDAREVGSGEATNVPKGGNRKEKEKMLQMDSETSDSDYVVSEDEKVAMSGSDSDFDVSDDDFIARDRDRVGVGGPRKKSNAVRKNDTTPKPRNKRRLLNSSALDLDRVILEEDPRDVAIGETPDVTQVKSKEKGKEKAADVFEKQVCGICLSEEQKATMRGVLDCCEHYFCFACIMEWSKVESKCPVCKRRFETICKATQSDPGFGLRNAVVKVKKRDQVYQPTAEEIRSLIDPYENVVCIVCQQGGHDNLMLLCDICDSPTHTYCAGLGSEVPEGNWYCSGCMPVDDGSSNSQVQDTAIDQGTGSNNLFSSGLETENLSTAMLASTNSQRLALLPGQTSSQIFDLNVSPRHLPVEDHGVTSQSFFTRLSTLSGACAPEQQRCFQDTRSRQIEDFSGSSNSQVKDTVVNQRTGSSDFSSGGRETQNLNSNMHVNASIPSVPFPGHSSLQNIDLNVSPRNLLGEDHGAVSQASGSGASTLSGRRALHRHIRMLLSDSRLRELFGRTYVPSRNVERM